MLNFGRVRHAGSILGFFFLEVNPEGLEKIVSQFDLHIVKKMRGTTWNNHQAN